MKRLIRKSEGPITDRAECDCRTMIQDLGPLYQMDDNSYMNYVNQNPNNKYIKKMKGELPEGSGVKTIKDYNEEYFESDHFTPKVTPSKLSSEVTDMRINAGITPAAPINRANPYTKDYNQKRDQLIQQQQQQRNPKLIEDNKSFKDCLEDKLRQLYD